MLPKLNLERFRKGFVKRVATRQVQAFMEKLGPERVEWIVANRRPLEGLMDEGTQRVASHAPHYAWVEELITDEEFLAMFPKWSLEILDKYGDEGKTWFLEQMAWMRRLFKR